MLHSSAEEALNISLLFLAMSAADRKILSSEMFVSRRCAEEFGIDEREWKRILNLSFVTYFNDGMDAVDEAVDHLKGAMDPEKKIELVQDLLDIALIDNRYHEKERELLQTISEKFGIPCPEPETRD